MPGRWQLQDAKNRFSEVIDRALDDGPQTVTRHGKPVAVIMSVADFDRRRTRRGPRGSLVSFLRSLSFVGASLTLGRSRDLDRDLDL